ncbi:MULTISPECIES: DUF5050 domain-containing protein [unclassified Paenibacillus]|uniref:stalk domain-containing protein n=1 Tax=unclassified Paenibacillus TaxID=185978 RepID=UPI0009545023|nr:MULTISPECIES: DUF5050 domain-containing protein [unclassified Paenibacillus]ASS67520.1 DUF5050 domain-containing protein [Paenibacillus sp. RUD330]SIQ74113.1 protein of unknown function [Paenibacillus sp. RU4X]SIQ95528.1 protein of unknown function [Paenibacillus sp. RU4T]
MKKAASLLLASSLCLSLTALPAQASEAAKPLPEVFGNMIVFPYDYQNKAFIRGQKTDIYGDFKLAQKKGRVLVPIRLMSYLATQADLQQGWEANWQQQKPDEVVLHSSKLKRTVKFTVNSTSMTVNGEVRVMDAAPQKVNGQIMLPLRSAAEAIGKKIDWHDGLILIGDDAVDWQDPGSLAAGGKVKEQLADSRKPINYGDSVPLGRHGNVSYYFKRLYTGSGAVEKLYRQADGQKEAAIELAGNPVFDQAKVIGQKLYYVAAVDKLAELHAYDLATGKAAAVAKLSSWKPENGWVAGIERMDGDLYIILHTGDLTVGSETLYRVDNGTLAKVADARSIIHYVKSGEALYLAESDPMAKPEDNLSRVDLKTGKKEAFGQPGYAYLMNRTSNGQGLGYSSAGSMYARDGYLYALGYKESDGADESSVYRISLGDQTLTKLTGPAASFWMDGGRIYYVEGKTGHVMSAGMDGSGAKTLVSRKAAQVQFVAGAIYYKVNPAGSDYDPGELFRYDLASGKETKLAAQPVSTYYAGPAGVYYLSGGYEPGIYRIDSNGAQVRVASDNIASAILTEEGMVYTMAYKEGIYAVK